MTMALPPGAWWDKSINNWDCREASQGLACDAAVKAAKAGGLELRGVSFSYPMRPDIKGERAFRICKAFRGLLQSSLLLTEGGSPKARQDKVVERLS